MSIKKLKKEKV